MPETVGDRVRRIREARGEKQPQFAQTLNVAAEVLGLADRYDNTMVSKMEVGRRDVGLTDVIVLAAVDPMKRGRLWLAWGDDAETTTMPSGPVDANVRPATEREAVELEEKINKKLGRTKPAAGKRGANRRAGGSRGSA